MSNIIQPGYGMGTAYGVLAQARRADQAGTRPGSFLRQVAEGIRKSQGPGEAAPETAASRVDAYKKHLESKYGAVILEDIGHDQESLEKIGKRMRGNDVAIAPNMMEAMARDPEKAAYYEGKIDDFFAATPRLKAHFAARGLTYEPCGVVIHKDGTVTYICGGGDSPERVAEVNRINRERDEKRAEQRERYYQQAAAAAAERAAQAVAPVKSLSRLDALLKLRMASAAPLAPEAPLPMEAEMFFI